jgi:hypothetical protein
MSKTVNAASREHVTATRRLLIVICVVSAALMAETTNAQNLPDLFAYLWPGINFSLSTNQVLGGDQLIVNWTGDNNATLCPDPPLGGCPELIGPACCSWDDGVFLVNGSTNWFLGTQPFAGYIPPGGQYYAQATFQVPPNIPPGIYGVKVWIDYVPGVNGGQLIEVNENNNAFTVQNAVTVLPSLSLSGISLLPNGSVRLELKGSTTQAVRIQIMTDFESNSWTDLTNLPPVSGLAEYIDDGATSYPSCFYRAVSP